MMQKQDATTSSCDAKSSTSQLSPPSKSASESPEDATSMSPNSESSTKENSCVDRVKVGEI